MIRRPGLSSSRSLNAGLARWLARTLLLAAAGSAAWAQAPEQARPVQAPIEAVALSGSHPAEYYLRAGQLFKDGRSDDAVFVFYLGQLRYRAHLMARPNLPRSGDAAAVGLMADDDHGLPAAGEHPRHVLGRRAGPQVVHGLGLRTRRPGDLLGRLPRAQQRAREDGVGCDAFIRQPAADLARGLQPVRCQPPQLVGLALLRLRVAHEVQAHRASIVLPGV